MGAVRPMFAADKGSIRGAEDSRIVSPGSETVRDNRVRTVK